MNKIYTVCYFFPQIDPMYVRLASSCPVAMGDF